MLQFTLKENLKNQLTFIINDIKDKKNTYQDVYDTLCFKKSGLTTTLFAIVGTSKKQMAVNNSDLKEQKESYGGIFALMAQSQRANRDQALENPVRTKFQMNANGLV